MYKTKHITVIDPKKYLVEENYSKLFYFLWPKTNVNDLAMLNSIIKKVNIQQKEEYKRSVERSKKSECAPFHALMIASSSYSDKIDTLWAEEKYVHKSKTRRSILVNENFGKYMKQWRCRKIINYMSQVMDNHETRETDNWWRFQKRFQLFNKKRMLNYELSHVLVFDESMSVFVPR